MLVVDDYKSIATAICRHLRVKGHEARAVHTGASAITEAARFEPHLVLLDIELKDMTGYDVAKLLRLHATAPMYIAAISSRREIPDANIDEHATKPFGLDRLNEILRHADPS